MSLTNKAGMPAILYEALCSLEANNEHLHNQGWSVTEILEPTRIAVLKKKYAPKLEIDAIDQMASALGTAVHILLEQGHKGKEDLGIFVEKKVNLEINGVILSGKIDYYNQNDELIVDYKYQNVQSWVNIQDKLDYLTWQLNLYKYLLHKNNYPVKHLQVLFIFKDFREYEAGKFKSYPETLWKLINIESKPEEEIEYFVTTRLTELEYYRQLPEKDLPPCSYKAKWQKPDSYDVCKNGKSIHSFLNGEYAYTFMQRNNLDSSYEIVKTVNKPKRCERYCPVKDICSQYLKECQNG